MDTKITNFIFILAIMYCPSIYFYIKALNSFKIVADFLNVGVQQSRMGKSVFGQYEGRSVYCHQHSAVIPQFYKMIMVPKNIYKKSRLNTGRMNPTPRTVLLNGLLEYQMTFLDHICFSARRLQGILAELTRAAEIVENQWRCYRGQWSDYALSQEISDLNPEELAERSWKVKYAQDRKLIIMFIIGMIGALIITVIFARFFMKN